MQFWGDKEKPSQKCQQMKNTISAITKKLAKKLEI